MLCSSFSKVIAADTYASVSMVSAKNNFDVRGNKQEQLTATRAVLYEQELRGNQNVPELLLNDAGSIDIDGLKITKPGPLVRLNKFYALAERVVQYKVILSNDAVAVFRSSENDFVAEVNMPDKKISVITHPEQNTTVNFLEQGKEYWIEIYHIYQEARVRISDVKSGEFAEISVINDGQGGVGKGSLQEGFKVGMQWDFYCFGLKQGRSMVVEKVSVFSLKNNVKLLMYGDSITQPEAYFPTRNFSLAWTQKIIKALKGNAMSSGRGGAQIDMVLNYIKNELPYIKTRYVMVTIGTNGGNTEAKLKELITYIRSHNAIPILNNIPCNESATQIPENNLIENVRRDMRINGCKFDLPTSLHYDGKQVDKATMYWEDYSESFCKQVYHHPNDSGSEKMFDQTKIDLPELYN
ncbi:hypothetical protein GCM10027516_32460 [Niabella aquatica]